VHYDIHQAVRLPELKPDWDDAAWSQAETLEVASFCPESSDHRPITDARLLYEEGGLHGIFRVQDRFVRCVRLNYFDEVWKDSCVEFFAEPQPGKGYFNFEFNCAGAFLCSHIRNAERIPGGFKDFTKVPAEIGRSIQVRSSLRGPIDPEITEPLTWHLRFFIPRAIFEHYLGPLDGWRGQTWRGNFHKCAEEVSHPHWATWSPVDELNFHRPQNFAELRFV